MLVSAAVDFSKDLQSFFLTSALDQPPRRFGKEEDCNEEEDRRLTVSVLWALHDVQLMEELTNICSPKGSRQAMFPGR